MSKPIEKEATESGKAVKEEIVPKIEDNKVEKAATATTEEQNQPGMMLIYL